MIYVFFWEHRLRHKLVNSWKDAFAQKWDENNIFHIKNVYEYDPAFYGQTLLSEWLFSQKTLCIIDDAEFFVETKNELSREYADFFTNIFPRIGEDVTLVFSQGNIDKRSKFFKDIQKIATLKDFSLQEKWASTEHIQKLYGEHLAPGVLQKLVEQVGEGFSALASEIEKLLLTKNTIHIVDLEHISTSREQNIFEIIDLLLSERYQHFLQKLRILAYDLGNPYYLYSSLLANLRPYAYIFLLQKQGKSTAEITSILDLGKRAFLVGKNYKIPRDTFLRIFANLLSIDTKMKSGHMLGPETQDMLYEIETSLLISQNTHWWNYLKI